MEELPTPRVNAPAGSHAQSRTCRRGFSAGALVSVRGEPWLVSQVAHFEACAQLTLQGQGAGNWGATLRVLTPFDRPQHREHNRRIRLASRRTCAAHVGRAVAEAHGWSELWTAARASMELLPWQLEPALAAVGGATRLLLGDEVGLGKTIQAGLILAELFARGLIERALILTPPGLRAQWRGELEERFGIHATEFDLASLTRQQTTLPIGANPWASVPVVLSSIDLVKRPEYVAGVEEAAFDALVIDEAHHVTPGTERGAMVSRLASRAPWLVLMSATPHSGDERAFRFLNALGGGGPLSMFRRRAADVRDVTRRSNRVQPVRPDADERALLDAVSLYTQQVWRERGRVDQSARLVAVVLARRAASSAGALRRTLARRCDLLCGHAPVAAQIPLPWEEHDRRDDLEADALLSVSGLLDSARERDFLVHLVALAGRAAHAPSKMRWVRRFLRRSQEQVVIFSEYRDTIEELYSRLRGDETCTLLHGGFSPAERRGAVDQFVGGSARVLLATDAGGEGLNLQARCRLVINVELPWNPARLEQRIGRVDRIGQTRRVHAIHLFHRDSIEDRVLATLLRRTRVAASRVTSSFLSMPPGPPAALESAPTSSERQVLGAAARLGVAGLDDTILNAIASAAFDGTPVPVLASRELAAAQIPAAVVEATRLLACRRLGQGGDDGWRAMLRSSRRAVQPPAGERWPSRACAPKPGVDGGGIFVFEATCVDAEGRLAARCLVPLQCELGGISSRDRRGTRALIQQLSESSRLREVALTAADARVREQMSQVSAAARGFLHRATMLREAAGRDRPAFVQDSLFDGRARRAAAAHARARDARRELYDRRIRSLTALSTLRLASPPRLVAVLPLA